MYLPYAFVCRLSVFVVHDNKFYIRRVIFNPSQKNCAFILTLTIPLGLQQINFSQAEFLLSAEQAKDWVADIGAEVAFVGRSNVGKSSAINKITNRRGLARTSKTPGRTQHVVFFELEEGLRLVDLPGYGFAKTPLAVKQRWQKFIGEYLAERESLQALIIPMDIRRPFTQLDQQMMKWAAELSLPVHVLLTKSDKLSRGQANATLLGVKQDWLKKFEFTVQLFSASKGAGVDEAREVITLMLRDEQY